MAFDFKGSGWGFPIRVDDKTGGLAVAQDDDKIRQSIWMILTTAPGERVMRGDFGCGIHNLVFESFSDAAIGQVMNEVSQALSRFEPRIDVLGIHVAPDHDEPNVMLISINYVVRSSNSRFNLVYPFYLS